MLGSTAPVNDHPWPTQTLQRYSKVPAPRVSMTDQNWQMMWNGSYWSQEGDKNLTKWEIFSNIDMFRHWRISDIYTNTPNGRLPSRKDIVGLMSRTVNAWATLTIRHGNQIQRQCTGVLMALCLTWHGQDTRREIDVTFFDECEGGGTRTHPSGEDTFPYLDLSDFTLSRIVDNPESPESLFDRTDNKWFSNVISIKIWIHLDEQTSWCNTSCTNIQQYVE